MTAVAYVEVQGTGGEKLWGAGIHRNITAASLSAVVSAANQLS